MKSRKKSIVVEAGMYFFIPSSSGMFSTGKIIVDFSGMIGVYYCLFFAEEYASADCALLFNERLSRPIAASFITTELIQGGRWPVCQSELSRPDDVSRELEDFLSSSVREATTRRFVGTRIVGSGLVEDYLDVFFGHKDAAIFIKSEMIEKFFNLEKLPFLK